METKTTPHIIEDPWPRLGAHAFDCCNTMGGDSHSHWSMLFYHKGVFIGYYDHDWSVFVSSDPTAKWHRGQQESRAWGNCMPQSETAKLMAWSQCPVQVQEAAYPVIVEAIGICAEKIMRRGVAETMKDEADIQARKDAIQTIVEAWT